MSNVWGLAYNWPGYVRKPMFFMKATHYQPGGRVFSTRENSSVWPEVELAVELDYILSRFAVANDVTGDFGGDLHLPHNKMYDGWCQIGKWKHHGWLWGWEHKIIAMAINGEKRVDNYLGHMIMSPKEAVARLSKTFPVMPGDILLMGTPPRPKNFYVEPGDVVSCYIEGLGEMVNKVV